MFDHQFEKAGTRLHSISSVQVQQSKQQPQITCHYLKKNSHTLRPSNVVLKKLKKIITSINHINKCRKKITQTLMLCLLCCAIFWITD